MAQSRSAARSRSKRPRANGVALLPNLLKSPIREITLPPQLIAVARLWYFARHFPRLGGNLLTVGYGRGRWNLIGNRHVIVAENKES